MPTRAELLAGLSAPVTGRQSALNSLKPQGASWDWSKPTYGTGKTYYRGSVTYKDGKFYSGTNELTGQDQISWDASLAETDAITESRPLWTFGTVGEALGTQKTMKGPSDWDGAQQDVENPDYALHSTTANPLKGDAYSNWMSSKHKDVLYGVKDAQFFRSSFDPTKWNGQDAYADKFRDQWGASNAIVVKETLRQLFPNKTEKEIDAAALRAFQSDRQVEQIWYGKYRPQTRKAGMSYDVQDNPISIIKNIAQQLGGLTPQQEAGLTRYGQEKLLPYMKKMEDGVDSYDDSQRGITGFLNDIGPAKYLALLVPGGATALALTEAAGGVERGDMRAAVANGIGAYLSYNAPTPTANPSMGDIATNAVKNIPKNAALQYVATGKVDPKSLAIGAGASAAGGMIGSQVGGAMSDPALGQRVGQAATGLISYGAREALRGSPPVQARKTTNTTTNTTPTQQPARSSWGRMPTVGVSRSDMLKTLTGG